jgi:cytochrome c oxidase subunit 2
MIKKLEGPLVSLLFAGTAIAGVAYGAQRWLPELASRHGAGIDAMLRYLLATVGALFVAGYAALAILIWQGSRRLSVGKRLASRKTEVVLALVLGLGMAVIAEGGVLAIGIPVWSEYFEAQPPADATLIEVTAQQFMWNVRYPGADGVFGRTDPKLVDETANPLGLDRSDPAGKDDVVSQNDITVPFGHAVHVRLHSKDVIHSFFLPNFRVKQDAVPGMTPEVVFFPTRLGTYELACAELCGLAHYRMRGFFHVVTAKEFADWLHRQQAVQ